MKGEDDRALLSARNRILVRLTTSVFETNKDGNSLMAVDKRKLGFRIIWSEVSYDSPGEPKNVTEFVSKWKSCS